MDTICDHDFDFECPICEEKELREYEWNFRAKLRGLEWELLTPYSYPRSPVTVKCFNNHVFDIIPSKCPQKCSWCMKRPFHKTAKKIFHFLSSLDISFYSEYKFPWIKKNYRYDFVLINKKIIIELDGDQHFEQIMNYESPEKTMHIDACKMYYAMNRGYTIIRLYQPDILNDTIDWMPLLHYLINKPFYEKYNLYTISLDETKYNKHKALLYKIYCNEY